MTFVNFPSSSSHEQSLSFIAEESKIETDKQNLSSSPSNKNISCDQIEKEANVDEWDSEYEIGDEKDRNMNYLKNFNTFTKILHFDKNPLLESNEFDVKENICENQEKNQNVIGKLPSSKIKKISLEIKGEFLI